MERLQEVTYPMPMGDMLAEAFDRYRRDVPWANDYEIHPKSVLRDMVETASDFNGYISRYGISRSEGTLLRYLSDAYRALDRTVPEEYLDERLEDIVSWLGLIVRSVDSSLVDEWEAAGRTDSDQGSGLDAAPPSQDDQVVGDRRGLTVLVRNAMFQRVELVANDRPERLAELDSDWGYGLRAWQDTLDDLYEAHDEIRTDAQARSADYFSIDQQGESRNHTWKVRQIFDDVEGDHDWGIAGIVDLDATQESGQVVFGGYRVGPIEELMAL